MIKRGREVIDNLGWRSHFWGTVGVCWFFVCFVVCKRRIWGWGLIFGRPLESSVREGASISICLGDSGTRLPFSGTPPVRNRSSPSWHKDGAKLHLCFLSSWIEVFLGKVDSQTSILLDQPYPIYLWSSIDYVMPGLCRILTLGRIWQLIVYPDPDKNLQTKSVHSKYICRNIFLNLISDKQI